MAKYGYANNLFHITRQLFMRAINAGIMIPGDIILTTSDAWESAWIRTFTFSDISHVMICVSTSSVMDSTGDGVHARNPEKMFYPESCEIYVMRFRTPPAPLVIERAIEYCRNATATAYDISEAVKSILPKKGQGNPKMFCSRLVAKAYASAGINLVANPDFCTPQELKASHYLEQVSESWIDVSDEDVNTVLVQVGDSTIGMRKVTMQFVDGVKKLDSKVESLNDAIKLAIERPDLDEKINQLLVESGYLQYWSVEEQKYPWRYEITEMVRYENSNINTRVLMIEQLKEYCSITMINETNGVFQHWDISLKSINKLHQEHRRHTLASLQGLYINLLEHRTKMVLTAKIWLQWKS